MTDFKGWHIENNSQEVDLFFSFNKTIREQDKVVDELNQKVRENNATVVSAKILEFEVLITSHVNNQSLIRSLTNFLCLVLLPGRSFRLHSNFNEKDTF